MGTTEVGQTAILVRWSAAQPTTEMIADQRTGKVADQRQRTTEMKLLLFRCSKFLPIC
jgi:hypothetical protein